MNTSRSNRAENSEPDTKSAANLESSALSVPAEAATTQATQVIKENSTVQPSDSKNPLSTIRYFVAGDMWKDCVSVTESHLGAAILDAHHPEHYTHELPGGAVFLCQLLQGALGNHFATKLKLEIRPEGREELPDLTTVVRFQADATSPISDNCPPVASASTATDAGDQNQLRKLISGKRYEVRLPNSVIIDLERDDEQRTEHKTTDAGYRPNLLKRAWEVKFAKITLAPSDAKIVPELSISDGEPSTTSRRSLRGAWSFPARSIEVSVPTKGSKVNISHTVSEKTPDMPSSSSTVCSLYPDSDAADDTVQRYYIQLQQFDQIPHSCIPESHSKNSKVFRRRIVLGESRGAGPAARHQNFVRADNVKDQPIDKHRAIICVSEDGLGFANRVEPLTLAQRLGRGVEDCYWVLRTGRYTNFTSKFYKSLQSSASKLCLAITSADSLRAGSGGGSGSSSDGIQLTNDVSWELVIEDLIDAIDTGRFAGREGLPENLLVVFGLAGCAYVHFPQGSNRSSAHIAFLFDPTCTEHEYNNTARHGDVGGILSAFTAEIARWFGEQLVEWFKQSPSGSPSFRDVVAPSNNTEGIMDACADALRACRRLYDYGYGSTRETIRKWESGDLPTLQIFHERDQHSGDKFACVTFSVPGDIQARGSWSILEKRLRANRSDSVSQQGDQLLDSRQRGALNLAKKIVRSGLNAFTAGTATRDAFPILKVGKLTTVDRGEIEGLRTIQEIFRGYLSGSSRRPASVAVFGAPGSGKSFGIKQVLESLGGPDGTHRSIEVRTFNLTQFSTSDHLGEALLEVSNLSVRGEVPAVFFDEFDVRDQQGNFRWIDRFLSVMEDGEVVLGGKKVQFGRAILVFAGGTHRSFSEFAEIPTDRIQADKRAQMKVPDFVSRLTGYLNVAGPNPRSRDELERVQAWIRRAVQIRGHIEDRNGPFYRMLNDYGSGEKRLEVDDRVLDALLRVEEYRHGSRSLRSVIDLCHPRDDRKLSVSAFPVWSLLEMHVTPDFRELALDR